MRLFITILFLSAFFSAFSQTGTFDYLTTNRRFTVAGRTVKGISNDSIWLIASADSLVTQYAVKGYVDNHFGPGTSNAYNFNPEQFIVSGYDVSIRFPQDPGEPLFTNSPSFNFTQQHLNFLDSLMLAVGEDTYLDDRDFYYSPDTLNPIRWKAFTLTTDGTGAASWDSANKRLNIPVSSSGGGSSSPYHLPYNGNANYYLAGDSGLHPLPVTDTSSLSSRIDRKLNTADTTGKWLPIGTFIPAAYVGDSIDYSFTSMTTIYNEAGPGEYTISSNDVSFNKDNLQNPFRQLKSLDVGGWNDGSYVSFKNTGNVNSTAYTFLRGFVRLKQTVPIIQSLSFRFYNAGVPVSQIVSMVNYGLDKSKINTYQNITIPISAFQFSSNTFDEVRLIFGGGSSPDGLYLDLFQFQNATVNENVYLTDVFRVPGSTQVKKILGGQTVDAYTDSIGIAVDTQYLRRDINANAAAIATKEPIITAGTTSQFWRGDKTWQTINLTGWSTTGNAIDPATNFLGTTNNTSIRFFANNQQKMRLDSSTGSNLNIQANGSTSYINLSAGSSSSPFLQMFSPGVVDARLYPRGQVNVGTNPVAAGLGVYTGSSLTPAGLLASTLGASGGYIGVTNTGGDAQVQVASPSGFSNFIKYRENGVSDRGVTGFANGSAVYQVRLNVGVSGNMTGGTLGMSVTERGVIFTQFTTTQRDALTGLTEGLTIYNLTTHQNETWNGSSWAH